MKKLFFSIISSLVLSAISAVNLFATTLPDIPDKIGRAGMVAGSTENNNYLIAGGANFPHAKEGAKTPEERGPKVFYKDIFTLNAQGAWEKAGELPYPLGYAAFDSHPQGLILAGGCNEKGHLAETILITPNGQWKNLPALPQTLAYAAGKVVGNTFYVVGGQNSADSTSALSSVYALDLTQPNAQWKSLPNIPGAGRILAAAGTDGENLYVFGGCSLAPGENGTAIRTYLKSAYKFSPRDGKWEAISDMPVTLAASPAPAPFVEKSLYLLGGDTGEYYRAALAGNPPKNHPGQSARILLYDTEKKFWVQTGKLSCGIATAPALLSDKQTISVISGETHPGIRTPKVQTAQVSVHAPTSKIVDTIVIALTIVVLLILLIQAKIKGLKAIANLSDPNTKPGLWAWITVGVLWVVVMLNYFDRQLLSALHDPLIADIHMTEKQFGFITAIFLIIYAVLSPVGGFLADRYSRRMVILGSLVIWSMVTWWTGHAQDYTTLLIARGAMGISEAFYIPAALALITDYHRGSTRSLATGIHMSGIYAGMALAGFGGSMSDAIGWRMTFAIFGLVGVLYAFVLIVLLRDPANSPADNAAATKISTGTENKKAKSELPVREVLGKLLGQKAMLILLGVVALAGAGNWFLLTWYPTLLAETFGLNPGEAGPQATLWSSIAKYIAVILGAIIADRWARKNIMARAFVPGLSFTLAGPCVVAAVLLVGFYGGVAWLLPVLLALVAMQGVAQGTMDATLMPVMRSHIDERYSATGYGLLNLTSAGIGALISFFGGWFKDQGIPLTMTLAVSGALMFICGILFIFLARPKKV